MQRKTFFKKIGVFLGFVLLNRFESFATTKRKSKNTINNIWATILDYARWSPSPHNVQPWKLKIISEKEAGLYYDSSRLLHYTDPTSCFTIVGLGMFIECLSIAANPLGYNIEIAHEKENRLDYTKKELTLFCIITLIPTDQKETLDRELIKKRRTSRIKYDEKIISNEIIQSFQSLTQSYEHTLKHTSDQEIINFIIDLNRETLFYDLDEDQQRIELSHWIRTTDKEAHEKKDGLWNKCMGFNGKLMHNFFFHHERFKKKWKRKIIGNTYTHSIKGTNNILWIAGKFENRLDWFETGRMFQRLWFLATQHGIYIHPFGSVVTNPIAYEKFITRVSHPIHSTEKIWLILRMGYSEEPPRSLRLDLNEVLIT